MAIVSLIFSLPIARSLLQARVKYYAYSLSEDARFFETGSMTANDSLPPFVYAQQGCQV